jgi:CHASE2 domain-containing sensor protein
MKYLLYLLLLTIATACVGVACYLVIFWRLSVIVTVPVAAFLAIAAACVGVACYFRSERRRWRMEKEKLAKTIQRLPAL